MGGEECVCKMVGGEECVCEKVRSEGVTQTV